MILRYLFLGIVLYWIIQRIFKLTKAVNSDPRYQKPKKKDDKHGGDYVDYEEIE